MKLAKIDYTHIHNSGLMASELFSGSSLAGDVVVCSWASHMTPAVPLSTQVYKWIPANLMLGVTL